MSALFTVKDNDSKRATAGPTLLLRNGVVVAEFWLSRKRVEDIADVLNHHEAQREKKASAPDDNPAKVHADVSRGAFDPAPRRVVSEADLRKLNIPEDLFPGFQFLTLDEAREAWQEYQRKAEAHAEQRLRDERAQENADGLA